MRRARQGARPRRTFKYGEGVQRSRSGCSGGRMPRYLRDGALAASGSEIRGRRGERVLRVDDRHAGVVEVRFPGDEFEAAGVAGEQFTERGPQVAAARCNGRRGGRAPPSRSAREGRSPRPPSSYLRDAALTVRTCTSTGTWCGFPRGGSPRRTPTGSSGPGRSSGRRPRRPRARWRRPAPSSRSPSLRSSHPP